MIHNLKGSESTCMRIARSTEGSGRLSVPAGEQVTLHIPPGQYRLHCEKPDIHLHVTSDLVGTPSVAPDPQDP
jgi:hypothetical protein